jgi:hypothetical protein
VDGEDGIDLQALLGAAADFQEAGDGTSRHSLDLPAGYDFEVRSATSRCPRLPWETHATLCILMRMALRSALACASSLANQSQQAGAVGH